jgi:5,10-methylenetetrahydromethanopterin reductase
MLLGIGAYWDPLAWRQGIDRRRPVKQMREYIEVTRRLLALETVNFEGELVAVRDLRLDLGHGVARVPKHVPIYVGATGPQMLALSGELADGVMLNGFTSLTYLADALGHIERGARRSSRRVDDLDLPQTIVIAMDEDENKALEVATRMTTMYLGQQPHIARASGVDQDLLDRVREAMGGWPPREGGIAAAMPLVPPQVVRSLTAAGTPEQCLQQVAAYSIRPNIYPALLPITENYEEIIEVFAPRQPPRS